MAKKLILISAIVLIATSAFARNQGYTYHEVQVYDELGRKDTSVSSVQIYLPGTTTNPTIYMDQGLTLAITLPMTTSSTNTTLIDGKFSWWGPDGYDYSITDGTRTLNNAYGPSLDGSVGSIIFPTWLQVISSSAYTDAQSITMGTDGDWVIQGGAVDNRLTFTPDTDGATLYFGSTSNQADVYFWQSSTAYMWWDESVGQLKFVGTDTVFDDDSYVYFGSGPDMSFRYDGTGNDLDIIGDDLEISFGADGDGMDLVWHTETSGAYVFFGEDELEVLFTNVDLRIDDDGIQYFGTGKDFSIKSSTANNLDILPITTDETSIINLGANLQGVDLKVFGTTSGDYLHWDASDDYLHMVGDLVLFTLAEAGLQFKVDATGTVAGDAIVLETTNGAIKLLADGSSNGDITIDAEDDIFLTAAGDLTFAITGTLSAGGSAIANQKRTYEIFSAADTLTAAESGKVCVSIGLTGAGAGDLALTLPAAAAGLTYTFVDANAVADDDLVITAGTGDIINGGSAAGSYRCSGDAVKQTVTLVARDETYWDIVAENGTWANEGP